MTCSFQNSPSLTWHRMDGIINKAKQAILKQYEEKLPRLTKPASFYRPDVATTISSPSCSVVSSSLPTVSLSCPVSLSRQSIPVRTEECSHLQTFDLHSAIFSLKITDIIKSKSFMPSPLRNGNALMYENLFCCPICQVKGPLYIDATITAALACLPYSVPKIAFTESGRFMAVEHQQMEEGCPVVTLQDSPYTYNTPCYLLPSSRATPPYMPSPGATSPAMPPTMTTHYQLANTSPAVPTNINIPTIVHHLTSTPQPATNATLPGKEKPAKFQEENGKFSSLRKLSLEHCLQAAGVQRYRRLSTVDLSL